MWGVSVFTVWGGQGAHWEQCSHGLILWAPLLEGPQPSSQGEGPLTHPPTHTTGEVTKYKADLWRYLQQENHMGTIIYVHLTTTQLINRCMGGQGKAPKNHRAT